MHPKPPSPAEVVATRVHASFYDFVEKRLADSPTLRQRSAQDELGAMHALRFLSQFPIRSADAKGRKFIFLSGRFGDLLECYSGEEAVIIGRARDLRVARRARMPFCFSGDLYAASHAILFDRKLVPTKRIINRWIRFLSDQQSVCYLVVANDTSPIALLLVEIARECRNVRVVCVQHGLFNPEFVADDIEGRNSHVNLVYDEGQKREMQRRLPGARVEVMGLPTRIQRPPSAGTGATRVIFVGTGNVEHPESYDRSILVFKRAAQQLDNGHFVMQYRPHPFERSNGRLIGFGLPLSGEPVRELLAGERKIFIGFNSTLLYEANAAGHVVVLLDDPLLPGYSISKFGLTLATSDLEKLPSVLGDELESPSSIPAVDDLRFRFESALSRAEQGSGIFS